jgi:SAM-dependent methyltransferase
MNSRNSFGTNKITIVDRFGVWLSQLSLKSELGVPEGKTILDVGSGFHASNLSMFQGHRNKLIALDFHVSPQIFEKAEYRVYEGNIETHPELVLEDDLDVILMINVLEHFRDDEKMIKWAFAKLAHGGKLVINVPTWLGKEFLEFSAFRLGMSPAEEMDDHKMYYKKFILWPQLVRAGFMPSKIKVKYKKFGLNLFAIATKG